MQLRPYQEAAVQVTLNWLKYKDTPAILSLPTGSGKTHVIGALAEHYYNLGKRVLIMAHRKELLEQAGNVINVPFGYYSASLGHKNLAELITIAGVQSLSRVSDIDPYDLIIADECHRLSNNDEGQYWDTIKRHPEAKLIGLSATPFRMKGSKLTWGEIVYEIGYRQLLNEKYLAPLVNKLKSTPDLSSVTVTAGDYSVDELEYVMVEGGLIIAAIKNIKAYSADRRSVLIFCVSVKHCHLLGDLMAKNDMPAMVVSGETPMTERDAMVNNFKSGALRYLINCEVFLEGFDAPNVDMIACLRPTKSKALWEQLLGRGVRKSPNKENCLLMDMSGNLAEHGGLGWPYREKGRKEIKREPGKICPVCETYTLPAARECPDCAFQFPEPESPKAAHNKGADTKSDVYYEGEIETYNVTGVSYREHKSKKKGTISLRVDYHCPQANKYGTVSAYYQPHHANEWVRGKAHKFFKDHGWDAYGGIEAYKMEDLLWHAANLRKPTQIVVDYSKEYPEIIKYVYDTEKSGSGDTARDSGVDTDILEGDFVPF